jgi:hypothetical protein
MPAVPGEAKLRLAEARVIKAHRHALIADRNLEEATEKDAATRAELAGQIAAAMPLLTDDQKRQLRPILAGTLDDAPEAGVA